MTIGDRDATAVVTHDWQLAMDMEVMLRTTRYRLTALLDDERLRFRWRVSADVLKRLVVPDHQLEPWVRLMNDAQPPSESKPQLQLYGQPIAVDADLPPGSYVLDLVVAGHVPA